MQKSQLERQHHEDILDAYERLRMWRHDSIGRMRIIEKLARDGGNEDVLRFIGQSLDSVQNADTIVTTGHPAEPSYIYFKLYSVFPAGL